MDATNIRYNKIDSQKGLLKKIKKRWYYEKVIGR